MTHIATSLPAERDLINATAICQHWRTILLSFPRLWCNLSGPPSKIRAYVQRSKSTPIEVELFPPELAELIAPHASRLVGLTVELNGEPSGFNQVIEHLSHPIPTLHSLRILADRPYDVLEFPSDLQSTFCPYLRRLKIAGILGFDGCQTFPYVTELTMHMSFPWKIERFLSILERFPVLEKLYVTFNARLSVGANPKVVTLPHVQEIKLFPFADSEVRRIWHAPPILEYLHLPNLKSLSLQMPPTLASFGLFFPIPSFGERLPTLGELPEARVKLGTSIGEVTFRSASQATLEYFIRPFANYIHYERRAWRDLPLHSVRRLIVDAVSSPSHRQIEWLVELWEDLKFLEDLEFRGECYHALGILPDYFDSEPLPIRTLTVRHRGERERIRALELKRALDVVGREVTLICIPDPGAQEVTGAEMDVDGLDGE